MCIEILNQLMTKHETSMTCRSPLAVRSDSIQHVVLVFIYKVAVLEEVKTLKRLHLRNFFWITFHGPVFNKMIRIIIIILDPFNQGTKMCIRVYVLTPLCVSF